MKKICPKLFFTLLITACSCCKHCEHQTNVSKSYTPDSIKTITAPTQKPATKELIEMEPDTTILSGKTITMNTNNYITFN